MGWQPRGKTRALSSSSCAPVVPNPGQTLCHSPSQPLCGFGLGGGGRCRQEHRERHSVHSCLLTAPGTRPGSPGSPKIPADSSVGERDPGKGMGRISWSFFFLQVPSAEGKVGGAAGGRWPARFLAVSARVMFRCHLRCQEVVIGAAQCHGWEPGLRRQVPGLEFWLITFATSSNLSGSQCSQVETGADNGSDCMPSGEDAARKCG